MTKVSFKTVKMFTLEINFKYDLEKEGTGKTRISDSKSLDMFLGHQLLYFATKTKAKNDYQGDISEQK